MKVKELIELLSNYDQNKDVIVYDVYDEWMAEVSEVLEQDNEVILPVR